MGAVQFMVLFSLWAAIHCSPFDDGKYNPKKYQIYNFYDDGKYYRSLDEGKYIPGDEGKYTYIYQQGLYPTDDGDYRYVHQVGPNGGFGGNGGNGGFGPGGPGGPDGPDGNGPRVPNKIDYIGSRIYAQRYPYIHKVIKGLVEKYVSEDNLGFGESYGSSINHYRKVYADKEIAVKCKYLNPMPNKTEEFVTQYPPTMDLPKGEKYGSYYSFRGTKTLNTVKNSLTNKLKLEYEVFVRVVETDSE